MTELDSSEECKINFSVKKSITMIHQDNLNR